MTRTFFSSFILFLKGEIAFQFVFFLVSWIVLKHLGVKYFIVQYNKACKILVPLKYMYDWYHVATQNLLIPEEFKPKKDGW